MSSSTSLWVDILPLWNSSFHEMRTWVFCCCRRIRVRGGGGLELNWWCPQLAGHLGWLGRVYKLGTTVGTQPHTLRDWNVYASQAHLQLQCRQKCKCFRHMCRLARILSWVESLPMQALPCVSGS